MNWSLPLPEARKELSPYAASKIDIVQINPDKIKVVIGRGGESINGIIGCNWR